MPNEQTQLGQQPQGEKPFYKKAWFWIIVVLILAISGFDSSSSNSSSDNSSSSEEYPALDSFIGLTVVEADTQAQAEGVLSESLTA